MGKYPSGILYKDGLWKAAFRIVIATMQVIAYQLCLEFLFWSRTDLLRRNSSTYFCEIKSLWKEIQRRFWIVSTLFHSAMSFYLAYWPFEMIFLDTNPYLLFMQRDINAIRQYQWSIYTVPVYFGKFVQTTRESISRRIQDLESLRQFNLLPDHCDDVKYLKLSFPWIIRDHILKGVTFLGSWMI